MMPLTCSIVRWSNFSSDVTSQKNTFTKSHVGNEQNPGCFSYIRDYTVDGRNPAPPGMYETL